MKRFLRLLWIPAGYAVGTVIGQFIYSAFGYETGSTDSHTWVKVVSSAPVILLMTLGFVYSFKQGRKHS